MTTLFNIKRPGGYGDVVVTSAFVNYLKTNDSNCKIHYYTKCKDIVNQLIPDVDLVLDSDSWNLRAKGIDLNLTIYPTWDGYPQKCMSKPMVNSMFDQYKIKKYYCMRLRSFDKIATEDKYITLSKDVGWSFYKQFPKWDEVNFPLPVIELGAHLSWKETASLIQHAACHVSGDTVTNHIAGAYHTPAVVVFGSTSPLGSGYDTAINIWEPKCTNGPCYIENKFANGYRSSDKCEFGGCINSITPKQIEDAINKQIRGEK
jgi:ADP-heptose:LPS heptosyltransferase